MPLPQLMLADIPDWQVSATVVLSNGMSLRFNGTDCQLANPSDQPRRLQRGDFVCGYQSGKWWKQTPDDAREFDPLLDIPYVLASFDDLVAPTTLPMRLVSLGELVEEARASDPTAKVLYHKIVDEPKADNPAFFTLETVHHMVWGAEATSPLIILFVSSRF